MMMSYKILLRYQSPQVCEQIISAAKTALDKARQSSFLGMNCDTSCYAIKNYMSLHVTSC